LQNFPVLTSVTSNGFNTVIQGTLNSTANSSFAIEFFSNSACDSSGFGEGQTFIGTTTVVTNGGCVANFNVVLPLVLHAGQVVTATATGPGGNTSEFSQCLGVAAVNPFDTCLQDDGSGIVLLVGLTSGFYQFLNCQGLILSGSATITRKGCLATLQVNGPDRRLTATIDTCKRSGSASIQVFSLGRTFTIMDRNTTNNTCTCRGSG
jgi:hypothetical protein